jgi:hypothetical protein
MNGQSFNMRGQTGIASRWVRADAVPRLSPLLNLARLPPRCGFLNGSRKACMVPMTARKHPLKVPPHVNFRCG